MKISVLYFAIIACLFFGSCQQVPETTTKPEPPDLIFHDYRANAEISFVKRIGREYQYSELSDPPNKDNHIAAFSKYVTDTLRNFTNWEFIVTDVNTEPMQASSYATSFLELDNNPFCNLLLVAPIKIDKTIDTIEYNNKVEFTYTILKKPSSDVVKKQLITIHTLSEGDTVIASGTLTHINGDKKIDFEPLFETTNPWVFDVLFTDLHIKHH